MNGTDERFEWAHLLGPDAKWQKSRLGEVLREVDVRAGTIESTLPVLSLTKKLGLIPQADRFANRVARADVSDYKVVADGWLVYNPYVIWEGAIHVLHSETKGLVSPVYVTWEVAGADPDFMDHVVKTTTVLARFSQFSSGVVQRRRSIRKTGFLDVEIALPERAVQHNISLLLKHVQLAREATDRVIAAAESFKTSLVRHLLAYGGARLDELTEVKLKETTVGLIPSAWSEVALGDVADLVQYGTSERCDADWDGVPVLRIPNILDGRIDTREIKYLSTERAKKNLELQSGDLVFVRTNAKREHTGRCAVFHGELPGALFASYLIRIRLRGDALLPEFVQMVAATEAGRRQLAGRASRAADGKFNINSQTIKTVRVPMPPIRTQESIVAIVESVNGKINAARRKRKALDAVMRTLIETFVDGPQRELPSWSTSGG